jgi:choline dehydrogenase-like flavoprotein
VQVAVIGAGPSGAVVSHTLASAGIDVACLEQGDWLNPTDYAANHRMWELVARAHWPLEPNDRANVADYPLEVTDTDLPPSMYSAVGGSTIHFGGLWPRLAPSDFRVRSLDGVGDDWPIRYDDLVPFYAETDEFIGASGLDGDPAYPDGLEFPQPPFPLGKAGRKVAEGLNKLGWHWWYGANAIPTHKHGDLAGCARWGTCVQGCPEGAKASFDLAYWPAAVRAGARLVTGARVKRILTDASGTATGIEWISTADNQIHRQDADYVVLCANGIGTARILMMSGTVDRALADSSGLVGKNLMLHPNSMVLGYYEDDLETWRGPLGAFISSMEFYETDRERGFYRGIKMHASTAPGLILSGVEPGRSRGFDQLWGPRFHDVVRDARSAILWACNIEDLPEETNRVTLDHSRTDNSGLPAAKISYRFSENTLRIRDFAVAKMTEAHYASGAKRVVAIPDMPGEPGHLLGTARMGTDPATSVVDPFGRCHDVPNLRIADGSIFVTGGSANPTSTIAALALRIGRDLVAEITKGAAA